MNTKRLLPCLLALSLAACGPGREAHDKRLAEACVAALKVMYPAEDAIELKSASFSNEKSPDDTKLRTAKIYAHYIRNRGLIEDKTYTCSFEETPAIFGYQARFYRLDRDGLKLGVYDGIMNGDLGDILKVNDVVTKILDPR